MRFELRDVYEDGTPTMREWHAMAEEDDFETEAICPACGSQISFCQGHGEIGDSVGYGILEMHDTGNHTECHPASECRSGIPWDEAISRFDDYLDETNSLISVMGFDYSPSTVFRKVNPIDYRQAFNAWADSEGLDSDYFTGTDTLPK